MSWSVFWGAALPASPPNHAFALEAVFTRCFNNVSAAVPLRGETLFFALKRANKALPEFAVPRAHRRDRL
jgi:ABC-type Fe3+ transport system permease subunit